MLVMQQEMATALRPDQVASASKVLNSLPAPANNSPRLQKSPRSSRHHVFIYNTLGAGS